MSNFITSAMVIANSRIDDELATAEASVIAQKTDEAEAQVLNYIGKTYAEVIAEYGAVPAPIVGAALALADWLYTQRSAGTIGTVNTVPYTLLSALMPYRRL